MRKQVILGAIGTVVVAAGIAVFLVVTRLDRMVASAVETYGSAATGTDVRVAGVAIALTAGRGNVSTLTVGNPKGYATDFAVRIEDIDVALDVRSLASGVPVVADLHLSDARVNAEQIGDATNLTDIQRYLGEPHGEASVAADPRPEARIIIDRFRLTNARVTLTSELLSEPEELELGDVVVEGIGRAAGGATYTEAAEAIFGPIFAAARSAAQQRLRDAAAESVREELRENVEEKAGERLKDLLDSD
jgi:hypothetical protein